jgi:tetratricopeptide (TPR) repeat protein
MRDHGLAEIKRAQKLGDNSAYVQTVLSEGAKSLVGTAVTGLPLTVGYTYRGSPEAQASMKEAEAAFAREDVAAALKLYEKAATIDPKWYDPALYTGDMYFRLKDATNASIWFQKAIHIDPDRDTAYRYWGDALFKSGARDEAKAKYEQAVVAEPYARPSWLSLQQWATVTKTPLALPRVNVPKYTTTPDGVLQPDPGLDGDAARSSGRTSWLAYETCRVKHGGNVRNFSFATGADGSTHPNGYYHSLAEEYECLRATLADVRAHMVDGTVTEQGLDPSIKTVLQLDKDGVLQCWIVLNDADQGIRFDYAAFRNEHRDQLVAYIDRYIVQIAP